MVTIAVDDELKPKSTPTDFNVYNAKDRKEFDEMLSFHICIPLGLEVMKRKRKGK